jgi:DNA primase small subunit
MDFDASSPDALLAFYQRLYPFKPIFLWLNQQDDPTSLFAHREFAFTLQGDAYARYNSFDTADDLKHRVCELNPTRFEIGPIYSAKVRELFRGMSRQIQPLVSSQKTRGP